MQQFQQAEWNEAIADDCRQLVRLAAREDLDRGQDWTTLALVPASSIATAHVVARAAGIVAGMRAAEIVVEQFDPRLELIVQQTDGTAVGINTRVATITGPARSLLTAERPLLNFIGHLSGIATLTSHYVNEVRSTKAQVYDTRKTLPGWRRVEKYAVHCGKGNNHRSGLYDAILIKDNHLAFFCGRNAPHDSSLAEAVVAARNFLQQLPASAISKDACIEIEVDTIAQFKEVLAAEPHVVLLDNMTLAHLKQCVQLRDEHAPQVILEASGGVNLTTIRQIAQTGVDRISVGALTHSAVWLDVGLDWESC